MGYVTTKDGVDIFYKDWGPQDAQVLFFHHGQFVGQTWVYYEFKTWANFKFNANLADVLCEKKINRLITQILDYLTLFLIT